jgi:hypothetical protein
MPKEKYGLCLKKYIHAKKHERKNSMPKSMNNPMLRSMKKKRKIAHTFK